MKLVSYSRKLSLASFLIAQSSLLFAQAREVTSMKELREVLTHKQPIVIMFFAPWCGACNSMKDDYNKVAASFQKEVLCIKINAEKDEFREVVDLYGVEAIPTIVFRNVGVMNLQKLNEAIKGIAKQPTLQKHTPQTPESKKENQAKAAPKPEAKKTTGKAAQPAKPKPAAKPQQSPSNTGKSNSAAKSKPKL